MARYYVEKDGEWNIFSTVIDDFLFDEFICLDALKARLLYERFKELTEDLDSLLTDRPKVNVMSYENAIECRHLAHDDESEFSEAEPQTEEWHDDCTTCRWHDGACTIPCCDYEPKDEPQTERSE